MESRYIDFDAARAERTKEPLILHAYGQDFTLPGAMPANLFLDAVAIGEKEQDPDQVVSLKDSTALLRRVLPAEVLDALLARDDFGLDDLSELTEMVMKAYSGQTPGNPPTPNRAARRATK